MHNVLLGVRAWGEAVFWGLVAGALYIPLALSAVVQGGVNDSAPLLPIAAILGAMHGLGAGAVAGVPLGIALGLASRRGLGETAEGRRGCRIIGGGIAGLATGLCGYVLHGIYDRGFATEIFEGPLFWILVPAGIAAVIFAWRSPAIVNSKTPTFVPRGTRPDAAASGQ